MDIDQKVPFSLESEQAVLGSILLDPELIGKASLLLKPEHFYSEKHKEIFEAMLELSNLGYTIEGVMLLEKLRENGSFETNEEKEYLLKLAEASSMIGDMTYYAKIVAEKAMLREVIDYSRELNSMCIENQELPAVLEYAERRLNNISGNRQNMTLHKLSDLVQSELQRLNELREDTSGKYSQIKMGISALDNFMGGFNRSDLILLAGRPGMGKTSFALNIAYNIAASTQNNPKLSVVFFSLEMSREQLARRIISSTVLIDSKKMLTGAVSEEEWDDIYKFWHDDLNDVNLLFDDTSMITVAEMKAKLRRVKNLGMVMIDYLQLMSSGKKIDNRVLEIGEITRSLKIMAKELNVPIILCSQLSRSIEQRKDDNKVPRLSDLRDSGSIEQDADIVIFLSRPEYYDKETEQKNVCEVIIEKNRHGAPGKVPIYWDGAHTAFRTMSPGTVAEPH